MSQATIDLIGVRLTLVVFLFILWLIGDDKS